MRQILLSCLLCVPVVYAAEPIFKDDFAGGLGAGWSWIRERPESWRIGPSGLEVRVEPGNMWGGSNNARNLLVRPAPESDGGVEARVTVENQPTEQYEQVNLVWYYSDSYMVKLGQELVDGKLSIVMGREENDRTRTIAIIPLDSFKVELSLRVTGKQIQGSFRTPTDTSWRSAGKCDLPVLKDTPPKISLHFYQGPPEVERWARVTGFQVLKAAAE